MEQTQKINAVFEGGGVKGTGLVGAVKATEEAGFTFGNVAGTSAGAIVASLIAAGYNSADLKNILENLDYNTLKDGFMFSPIPLVGPALNIIFLKGIYGGNYFEQWIGKLLAKKGIKTFKDLIAPEFKDDPRFRYRLQVIASDITRGKLLVLPTDARDYGIDPDEVSVARAIRMSMSLPYFYQPVKIKSGTQDCYIVDGGILSNFPVWILDDDNQENPSWPTFGYKLVDPKEDRPHRIYGPVTFFAAMFNTMLEAHDARYIKDQEFMRTIPIQTLGIGTTDFGITLNQKELLYESGLKAGREFFAKWDFEKYKRDIKEMKSTTRKERLQKM